MRNNNADIIVVGGGVMGCATAYQLAKDGVHVLLLEQFAIGNRQGSAQGASRLFRLAHTSTDFVELARAAHALWRELENESGERLMQQVDGIDLGTPDALEDFRTTLHAANVSFETLERDEIMRRFPHFALPEEVLGLFQDSYVLLAADRCVGAFAREARRHGVTIAEGQTVQQVRPVEHGVEVRTEQATYRAGG